MSDWPKSLATAREASIALVLTARVVHFATHGLLAKETALFAKDRAEPARLKLNADWMITSACDTAAGWGQGAEALSGLAVHPSTGAPSRLLVSHWEVDSDAAAAIITGAMSAMKAEPKIGRAEAPASSCAARTTSQPRSLLSPSA
ncbi:MAG: CHAT domain-containing protein [Rhodomicrobium sp.]